jgi:glycosyltransferase involved in cell wall biosynthesis
MNINKDVKIETLEFSLDSRFYIKNKDIRIIHLHWPAPHKRNSNAISYLISNIRFIQILLLSKILGFKIIWTVHNILPHISRTLDKIFRFITYHICDCIVVQSLETKKVIINMFGNHKHIKYIPHGNYIGIYKGRKSKELKKRFKIKKTDFVFLFFGSVEKYKGLPELIDAFNNLNISETKLFIVGKVYDSELKKMFSEIKNKNIVLVSKFISDDEIKSYFDLCDVVVLPFRRITTSGSLVLSMSLGKLIIVPDFPVLKEYAGDCVLYFKAGNIGKLKETMIEAKKMGRKKCFQLGGCAIKRALKWDWKIIGRDYADIYKELSSLQI